MRFDKSARLAVAAAALLAFTAPVMAQTTGSAAPAAPAATAPADTAAPAAPHVTKKRTTHKRVSHAKHTATKKHTAS